MSKERFSTQLPAELVQDLRATVLGLQAQGHRISLSDFCAAAIAVEINRAQRDHHDGKPWPTGTTRIPPGRPIGE